MIVSRLNIAGIIVGLYCLLFSNFAYCKKYSNLPISAFGVANSKLTLIIEDEILVPSLTKFKVNEDDLYSILPFENSIEARNVSKTIVSQAGISLGHTMPYLYIAINHAFDRIYYNSFFEPRKGQDSLRKEMGFTTDLNADGFRNIREILDIKKIANENLTIEFYSSMKSLRLAQSNLKFISEDAFWDPANHRIGLFLDLTLFRWLPSQVNWHEQTTEEAIKAVRNYVAKRVLQTICHELVHFIQFASKSKMYNIPFLAEASAIFLEENINLREDIFEISKVLTASGRELKLPPASSPCRVLIETAPPLSALAMTKMKNGIEFKNKSKRKIEEIILMDDKTFYSRTSEELQKLYDLSVAFSLFAGSIPRDKFKQFFGPLFDSSRLKITKQNLSGLDNLFNAWSDHIFEEWWTSPDIDKVFSITQNLSTECLSGRDYFSAYFGAESLVAMRPNSAVSWMYCGDVFWNLQIPFFAFDFYARALQAGAKYGYDQNSEIRVLSRLGDGYEALGDLNSAVKKFKELRTKQNSSEPESVDLVVLLRSNLKEIFYQEMLSRGQKQSYVSILLVNEYVNVLHLAGCPTDQERQLQQEIKKAIDENDFQMFRKKYQECFETVKKEC